MPFISKSFCEGRSQFSVDVRSLIGFPPVISRSYSSIGRTDGRKVISLLKFFRSGLGCGEVTVYDDCRLLVIPLTMAHWYGRFFVDYFEFLSAMCPTILGDSCTCYNI